MRVRSIRAIPVALSWIVFQSATASYIHGNSLGQLIANHLPLGGLFFLTVVVFFVNPLLSGIRRGLEFSGAELAMMWVMISAASAVPGYGMMEFFFPFLVTPVYFASPENQWKEVLWPHLPQWLYVSDRRAVEDFYVGEVSLANIPWAAWTNPAAFWIALSLVFFALFICWAAIVRRQWVERERYPFPLVQVPALVVEPPSGRRLFNAIAQSPFFWAGLSVALLVHLLKGLHNYWPFIPHVPTAYSFSHLITERPWNALFRGWALYGLVYLSVIGVTYFLQLDVSLSLWFFFLLYKFQEVFFTAFSITGVSTQHQVMGADLVLFGFLLWMARHHLYDVFRKAFNPRHTAVDDENEPLSYRGALLGIGFSVLALIGLLSAAGMSLGVILVFIFLLWMMATITTWMVANAGMLIVNIGVTPFSMLTTFFGTRPFGPRNLTLLAFDRSVISTWSSESLMPYVLQGFRFADYAPVKRRRLPLLMAIAILVAVAVAYYSSMVFIYWQGALNLEGWVYNTGHHGLNQANYAIQYPRAPNFAGIYSAALGAGVTGFLLFMRHQFLWWPLHPLGYVVGVTYAPFHLWFSVVLGWAIKLAVLKVGGFGAYRKYRPFFLGLILGEYFMAAFWLFIGLFTRVSYWGLPH